MLKSIKKRIHKLKKKRELYLVKKEIASLVGKDFILLPSSLEGHYPLISAKHFYKFAFMHKEFFDFEKENYAFLQSFSAIQQFLPYYEYFDSFFKTNKLNVIEDKEKHLLYATNILQHFKQLSKVNQISLEELPYLQQGLEYLELADKELAIKARQKVCSTLENSHFHIGPCHGDFHPKNVLESEAQPSIIDFDCVRKNSIQAFDALYFFNQCLVDYEKIGWWFEAYAQLDVFLTKGNKYKDFITSFMSEDQFQAIKFLYFLDRLGQDHKYEKSKNINIHELKKNIERAHFANSLDNQ